MVELAARRWRGPDVLTDAERKRIAASIAIFQLGEQSDGVRLMALAERRARQQGLNALPAVTRYFIREEQHHAAQLREFMRHHGIALRNREWTDSIFRRLRHAAGFEWSVRTLVTAEVIGFVYYRALRRATSSAWLRQICRDFCADETVHLRYEADLLTELVRGQSLWRRAATASAHRLLLAGASWIVFFQHRAVLTAAGYDAARFRRTVSLVFSATAVRTDYASRRHSSPACASEY